MNERYLAAAKSAGLKNIIGHQSFKNDMGRWLHGKEIHGEIAEAMYEPRILNREFIRPQLELSGELLIPGFLITRFFEILLGNGESAVARLQYSLGENRYEFQLQHMYGAEDTTGWLRMRCGVKGIPLRVFSCDGQEHSVVIRQDCPGYFYVYNLKMNSKYTLQWA
jgi:hypothetical protein